MMQNLKPLAGLAAALLLMFLTITESSQAQTPLTTRTVISGMTRPVFATSPPGEYKRLFIAEQRGSAGTANRADIRILDMHTDTLYTRQFHTVSPVNTASEEGLLGLAFHPDYENNRFFFTYHTNTSGNNIVTRWQTSATNPDSADPTSGTTILTLTHPVNSNHNGGWIGFGPDGYLYIAVGDGGGGGDQSNNAQNLNVLLGKMLRIDVDLAFPYSIPPSNPFAGGPQREEIFYWGLRNPWRNSFDRLTGELYIADVGQNAWEEVNWRPAADTGNINFGWRLMEGLHCYNPAVNCDPLGITTLPIHEYSHGFGCSITGGYCYSGCAIPDLQGTYFFGDYCEGTIWSFRYDGVTLTDFEDRTSELGIAGGLFSFAEDNYGEIYIIHGGQLKKIVPDVVFADCNGNQISDSCEIAVGVESDTNSNGIPDSCDPTGPICGDADGNGIVNVSDGVYIINYVFAGGPAPDPIEIGDVECNSLVNISDAVYVINFVFSGGDVPCSACL